MSRYNIIVTVIALVMAVFAFYFGINFFKVSSHDKETSAKNDTLKLRVAYCEKVQSIIKVYQDSVRILDSMLYHPRPTHTSNIKIVQKDSTAIHNLLDSISGIWHDAKKYLRDSDYDSVYHKDRFHFRYRLHTFGSLDWINFTDIVYPKDSVVDKKVIDTCFTKPAEKVYWPKNHLTLDFMISGHNFKDFPGMKGLFGWSIKDRARISIGGEYLFEHSEANVIIGFGWYLK